MAGNVKIIPPREKESSVLRVAAYCRVSTELEEQTSRELFETVNQARKIDP